MLSRREIGDERAYLQPLLWRAPMRDRAHDHHNASQRDSLMRIASCLFVAALWTTAVPATAATIVRTANFNSGTIFASNAAEIGFNSSVQFAGFDAALGQLDGVTLVFRASAEVTYTILRPNLLIIRPSSSYQISGPLSGMLGTPQSQNTICLFDSEGQSPPDDSCTRTLTVPTTGVANSAAPNVLAQFVTPGLVNFTLSGAFRSNGDPNGTPYTKYIIPDGNRAEANGVLTLIYSYTPLATAVPEPATWAMMLLGFGVVGAGLRRRRLPIAYALS
jgi:PEP-CTERM motif